jgi:rfaE bifunctional protein kinase chain/domain
MAYQSIKEIFNHFNGLKALVIGDLMIDSYIYGKASRISPEAPVPIVHVRQRERRLGGAGNVALNLKSLGAETTICALIGQDAQGEEILERLEAQQIKNTGIVQSSSRPTTVKERIIAGFQHMLRIDSEDSSVTTSESIRSIC